MGYTEIHFHLLPGVDDGPPTFDASLELAAAAAAEGTRTIVATPHVHRAHIRDVSILPDLEVELAARLREARIPIEVVQAAELAHDMVAQLSERELEVIAVGPRGRRWLLLEASLDGVEDSYTVAADELRARGFAVVVAHPERAIQDPEVGWRVLEHELAAGSAVQVNAWSVAGVYGERIRRNALRILQAAPNAAIASDAHGPARMPALGLALEALREAGDREPVRRIQAIPSALVHRGLPAPEALAA